MIALFFMPALILSGIDTHKNFHSFAAKNLALILCDFSKCQSCLCFGKDKDF